MQMAGAVLTEGLVAATQVLPMRPGDPCGDAAAVHALPDGWLLAIVDGLGHGAPAAQAALAAMDLIAEHRTLELPALLSLLDARLVDTRGAAVGLARVRGARLRYAGVGNTRALRWRGTQWTRLSSRWGIVGGGQPLSVDEMEIDLQPEDWLLMYTDGLEEMLSLPAQLPEWRREPALLCEQLLARWRVNRDDAGVLALHVGGH